MIGCEKVLRSQDGTLGYIVRNLFAAENKQIREQRAMGISSSRNKCCWWIHYCPIGTFVPVLLNFDFKKRREHGKKFLWASHLWVGRLILRKSQNLTGIRFQAVMGNPILSTYKKLFYSSIFMLGYYNLTLLMILVITCWKASSLCDSFAVDGPSIVNFEE